MQPAISGAGQDGNQAAPPRVANRQAGVAIIGAGVIGLCCALRLAQDGHDVVLFDPAAPGSGASFGNAGTVADYAVLPVANPGLLRELPRILFAADSPLGLRWRGLGRMLPWLALFGWNCLPHRSRANAAALAALLVDSAPRWQALARRLGAADLLRATGCLYAMETAALHAAGAGDAVFRRRLGVALRDLTPAEVAALEPGLPPVAGAHFFASALHLADPGAMMARLATACRTAGVRILSERVTGLEPLPAGARLHLSGRHMAVAQVVIAAGAQSAQLARQAGERVLLDTERGYHLEFDMAQPLLSRPVASAMGGFYMVPMQGRLRVAGTVELGGTRLSPDPARLAMLERGARRFFPDLPRPDRHWSGFRPSVPGMVPVIRRARRYPAVIMAFGHGHLGLTLAPITAARVAALSGAPVSGQVCRQGGDWPG
ncbi:MAG: FAD-dependent oxidoreductase [Pararhodobacter sp.]|nr:FAD-dependent oxidoreductase [Pararhodobacter sp.]